MNKPNYVTVDGHGYNVDAYKQMTYEKFRKRFKGTSCPNTQRAWDAIQEELKPKELDKVLIKQLVKSQVISKDDNNDYTYGTNNLGPNLEKMLTEINSNTDLLSELLGKL